MAEYSDYTELYWGIVFGILNELSRRASNEKRAKGQRAAPWELYSARKERNEFEEPAIKRTTVLKKWEASWKVRDSENCWEI